MIRIAAKFGAFVLVCLAFTLWLAVTIGNLRPFEDTYSLSATFDDVTGLLEADNVKIAGVVVGRVTDIKVDRGRARVTFNVRDNHELPSDTVASIRWRNLIGQRYLYLHPGTEATTVLQAGDVIEETTSAVDLGELFNRLGPIVQALDSGKVNEFLDTLAQALEGNEDKVGQAIDDLAVLASGLAERDQAIGNLVEDLDTVAATLATRDQQLRTMLDNLVAIAQTFSDNTDVLDAALVELAAFSRDLDSLLSGNTGELDRLITNLDLVVQTVAAKLPNLDNALGGLPLLTRQLFRAGRLGEWLNQEILCFSATGPAGDPLCNGVFPIGDLDLLGQGVAIGSAAESNEAGGSALVNLLTRGLADP